VTPRSSPVRALALVAVSLSALATAGLAFAQRSLTSQGLPFAGGYRGSIGADPPLDRTAAERAEVAARVYRALLRGEARRYLAPPHAGEPPPDASAVFDARLAERLGEWSLRWMEAGRNSGGRAARFEAARAHLERMRGLETGRALQDALREEAPPGGRPLDLTRLGEFADVAQFYRLDAQSRLQDLRAR
jgi:hypothetical protein